LLVVAVALPRQAGRTDRRGQPSGLRRPRVEEKRDQRDCGERAHPTIVVCCELPRKEASMGLSRLGKMPPTVSPQATVLDAVHAMMNDKVGALAVTEGGKLLGVFTERDLMTRVVARGRDPATTPVGEVMTAPVQAVPDDTSVRRAAALMRANHFRHLPIVDENGELLCMVALRFLLYDVLDDLAAKVDDLEGYLMEDSRGG
jgi:CBS domain-containing protein